MEITVRLYLAFRTGRQGTQLHECRAGATAGEVARSLGIRDGDIGMVLVNQRQAELEQMLRPGDTLSLFPVVGGG